MSTMNFLPPRLPMLAAEAMTDAQRAAADALINSPRKGVKGPFIALLRSPPLLEPVARLGAYLRFESPLPRRVNEFATLVVSRHCSQQFEWATHVPLALAAGTLPATIEALAQGTRPLTMDEDEALTYDFATELLRHQGVSDLTWSRAEARFGESVALDLVALVGYFSMISLVINVARTPPEAGSTVPPLGPLPAA